MLALQYCLTLWAGAIGARKRCAVQPNPIVHLRHE
jgi:hypothetical protein